MDELYGFQKTGVEFLVKRKTALLADEPGLGKTIQAICAADRLKARKILVVCPAIVKLNWEREIKKWSMNSYKIHVLFGRNDPFNAASDVCIVNYDLLTSHTILKSILTASFAVGIFDESHYLKSRKAKRTKAILLRGAVASRCIYKWFLTGTPILNRPIELYPLLRAVAPEVMAPYLSYDAFVRRFCGAYWDGFQLVAKGSSHEDELSSRLNNNFMLRRMKRDVLKELPDKQYQMIQIPTLDAKMKDLVKKEFTFSKGDARRVPVGADGAELAIIRHELARAKVKTCLEHIENVLEEVPKVVVFAYHKDVIASLVAGLAKYGVRCITGDTPAYLRQIYVDDFQKAPSVRVFVGQIQAAGTGITLTAASHVIFVETDWTPGIVDQAVDRCHRIGQKDSVLVQFLVVQDSLEEYIVRTIIDKKATIAKILDLDPAVAEMFG